MRRTLAVSAAVFTLALAWMAADPEPDPGPITAPSSPHVTAPITSPPGGLDVVVPEHVTASRPAVICLAGMTLNDAGDGCEPLPVDPSTIVILYEDGGYERADGTTGCLPRGWCND